MFQVRPAIQLMFQRTQKLINFELQSSIFKMDQFLPPKWFHLAILLCQMMLSRLTNLISFQNTYFY